MINVLRILGRTLARKRIRAVERKLDEAGLKANPEGFVGMNFIFGILLSGFGAYLTHLLFADTILTWVSFFVVGVLYYIIVAGIVGLLGDQRGREVERVLPDALELMSSNLRSGVSSDRALILSARPEFGLLSKKIKHTGDQIAAGLPISKAFSSIPVHIKSSVLKQTIDLIIEGIGSGGELTSILDGTAADIRDSRLIRKEVRSVILVYATFIFIAVAVISPVLYSVSIQLAATLSKLSTSIGTQFATGGPAGLNIVPTNITEDFLLVFAYVNLVITTVFGSLIMALINKGNIRYGLRYIPFIMGIALILFNIGRFVLKSFFGGIRVL